MRSRSTAAAPSDDELPARGDFVAHEQFENRFGLHEGLLVLHADAPEGPAGGLHGRLGELVRIHPPRPLYRWIGSRYVLPVRSSLRSWRWSSSSE